MKTAKFNLGDVVVRIPGKYLEQQTCISSVFDGVPAEMIDQDALIEANGRDNHLTWYKNGDDFHVSVPTELIKWDEEE